MTFVKSVLNVHSLRLLGVFACQQPICCVFFINCFSGDILKQRSQKIMVLMCFFFCFNTYLKYDLKEKLKLESSDTGHWQAVVITAKPRNAVRRCRLKFMTWRCCMKNKEDKVGVNRSQEGKRWHLSSDAPQRFIWHLSFSQNSENRNQILQIGKTYSMLQNHGYKWEHLTKREYSHGFHKLHNSSQQGYAICCTFDTATCAWHVTAWIAHTYYQMSVLDEAALEKPY